MVNSQSDGLPYANIVILGTAKSTISQFDGLYKLTLAKEEYKLDFQYIGL